MKPDESDRLRARYIKAAFGLKKTMLFAGWDEPVL